MARRRKLPKVLSAPEQEALLVRFNARYQSPHRNRVLVLLMLRTGLRCAEALALRPEHLEFDEAGGRLVVREGKGAKDRVLYFGREVRDELRAWLERRPDSDYLFCAGSGKHLDAGYVRRMLKREAYRAGIKEAGQVSPHTLRHTFATDLLRQTGNLRTVQEALGHADISTTQIYAHLANGEVEEAMRDLHERPQRQGLDLDALLPGVTPEQLAGVRRLLEVLV